MEQVELDGAPTGAGSGAPPQEQPVPHYEIDLDPTPSAATATARPSSPAVATPPDPVQSELATLREQVKLANERAGLAYSGIAPYLSSLQRAAQGPQDPAVTMEQLLHDPNVTTAQLIQWVQQENQRTAQTTQQTMELTARRGASELHARGLFQGEGFEGGYDFDSLRSKYLTPLFERMPFLRDVLTAINPEQPAMAEYGLATLLELSAAAKDDPVAFYRNLWAIRRGTVDDQGQKITQAARTAAARIAPGGGGRQTGSKSTRVDAEGIQRMSDREFEDLERQVNGG